MHLQPLVFTDALSGCVKQSGESIGEYFALSYLFSPILSPDVFDNYVISREGTSLLTQAGLISKEH